MFCLFLWYPNLPALRNPTISHPIFQSMQFYGLRCTLCGWKIPTGGGTGLILPCQAASYKPQYLLRLEFEMF